MLSLLYLLLLLPVARGAATTKFETRTYNVEERVSLKCPRKTTLRDSRPSLHWMRVLSGNIPEFLGGTFMFDYDGVNKTSRFTTKQDKGTFDLIIEESKLTDTGFYYCVKVQQLKMELVSGTFVKIDGPASARSVESPELSGPVDSGDSVDLQCWVQTENTQCFEELMVWWFRSGLDQSGPGLVYAQRNSSGQCDRSTEDHGPHKCFYTFSKTMSRSDTGTYRCAVAACGQMLFGNTVQVHVKNRDEKTSISETVVITVLSVALTMSLAVVVILICSLKKRNCVCAAQNQDIKVMMKKEDCEAALHKTTEAAEAESLYTYVTFVYVK